MPNITEYSVPVGAAPNPSDRAISVAGHAASQQDILSREAGKAIGGAVSRVGSQVGAQIDQHNIATWISQGAPTYSALFGNLTEQWNQLASKTDPNDTSIAQGFKEKTLAPSVEKFQQAFEDAPEPARKWAMNRAEELSSHFFTKMTADMGTRAADAVQQNIATTERNYSNIVGNDPSALSHVVDSVRADVKAMVEASPYITPQIASRVHNELVPVMTKKIAQSAFDAMAQANPGEALKALDHGDFNAYADQVTQQQWRRYAEGVQKAKNADDKRDELQARMQKREDSSDLAEAYRTKMYDPSSGRILPVSPKLNLQIVEDMKNGKLLRADGTALIRWNQSQYHAQVREDKELAKGAMVKNDPDALSGMVQRIGTDDNPLTRDQIVDALNAEKITTKTAHDLVWRVSQRDPETKTFNAQYSNQLSNVRHGIMSDLRYVGNPGGAAAAVNQLDADAQAIVRATPAGEARRALLDPKSKTYLFAPERVNATLPSPRAAVAADADKARRTEAGVVYGGFRFPTQAAADAYKAAGGK